MHLHEGGSPDEVRPEPGAPNDVAAYVRDSIDAMTEQRARTYSHVTFSQRLVEWLTEHLGTPQAVLAILVIIAAWIAFNVIGHVVGRAPFDPYPFFTLQALISLGALLMTLLILATQNRLVADAAERSHLALHMGIVTEQKVAKIIALIEEQRRDDPSMHNRPDAEAEAMAEVANPSAVSDALDISYRTMLRET